MKQAIILLALQYINLTTYTRLNFNCFVHLNLIVYLMSELATHVSLEFLRVLYVYQILLRLTII